MSRQAHFVLLGMSIVLLSGCARSTGGDVEISDKAEMDGKTEMDEKSEIPENADKMIKTDAEWREQLTPEQYRIARQKGTEPAFGNEYWDTKTEGVYHCVCCDQPVYSSDTKYASGSGWPSYWAPIDEDAVEAENDRSLDMERAEVLCSRCGAHLGHVFPDGPEPTGMRHCINSASLRFVESE